MSQKPKPTDSIQLIIELVGFFKSAAIVLGMTIIEWARAKQAHAEDKQAVAESELAAEKAKHAIENHHKDHSSADVVRDYLDSKGK